MAVVVFFAATRFVIALVAGFAVRFGAALALLATALLVVDAAFFGAARLTAVLAVVLLAAGFARAGAFFLAATVDLAAVFALAVALDLAAAFGFALLAAGLEDLRDLVEGVAAFFFGVLPYKGGVAPFNLDATWVATAIKKLSIGTLMTIFIT